MSTFQDRLSQARVSAPLATPAVGWAARLRAMWLVHRTRRLLAEMDDRQLADIGIGRGDALMEAGRPAWQLGDTLR